MAKFSPCDGVAEFVGAWPGKPVHDGSSVDHQQELDQTRLLLRADPGVRVELLFGQEAGNDEDEESGEEAPENEDGIVLIHISSLTFVNI